MAVPMRLAVATVTCDCGGRVASSAMVMCPPGFLIDRRRISETRARPGYQNISTPFGAYLTCVVFATEQPPRKMPCDRSKWLKIRQLTGGKPLHELSFSTMRSQPGWWILRLLLP